MSRDAVLGTVVTLNGDPWVVVDVAPAEPLAEMVAGLLEEEGFVTVVRGAEPLDDVFSHLGAFRVGTALVLVPEGQAEAARKVIDDTVTDFQGEELEALLTQLEEEGVDPAELGLASPEEDDDEQG